MDYRLYNDGFKSKRKDDTKYEKGKIEKESIYRNNKMEGEIKKMEVRRRKKEIEIKNAK